MNSFEKFQITVKNYAKAYSAFEKMQKELDFVPVKGDQKTGVVGEAYIYEYLRKQGYKKIEFGKTSQESWDIKYKQKENDRRYIKIQVKTVSEFADKKIISHIRPGFDILYLVKLNKDFYPINILKVTTDKDWPEIKHKEYPQNFFSFKNYNFQTVDETEKLKRILKL